MLFSMMDEYMDSQTCINGHLWQAANLSKEARSSGPNRFYDVFTIK